MKRNAIWVWYCYDAQGKCVGSLDGCNEAHALEEASYEYPDTVTVKRVRGSGRPNQRITPSPDSVRYRVRYVGHDGKRHKVLIRTFKDTDVAAMMARSVDVVKVTSVTVV